MDIVLRYTDYRSSIRVASVCKKLRIYNIKYPINNWDRIMWLRLMFQINISKITPQIRKKILKEDIFMSDFIRFEKYFIVKPVALYSYNPDIIIDSVYLYPKLFKRCIYKICVLHYIICEDCFHFSEEQTEILYKLVNSLGGESKVISTYKDYIKKSSSFKIWHKLYDKYNFILDDDPYDHKLCRFRYRVSAPLHKFNCLLQYKEGFDEEVLNKINVIYMLPENPNLILKWIKLKKPDINEIMLWFLSAERNINIKKIMEIYDIKKCNIKQNCYYNPILLKKYSSYICSATLL